MQSRTVGAASLWGQRAILTLVFLLMGASSALAQSPLSIQQIFVDADGVGFIEIINTTDAPVSLDDVHLTTVSDYYQIANGNHEPDSTDILVGFEPGSVALPGEFVVQLTGTNAAFLDAHGFEPDHSLAEPDAQSTQRVTAVEPIPENPELNLEGDIVVLFRWDGLSDLVEDLDIVFWGADGPRVNKSSVSVDGPDDDDAASDYSADTPTDEQRPATALTEGQALVRVDGPVDQIAEGGNGVDGADETSEDLGAAFELQEPVPTANISVFGSVISETEAVDGLAIAFRDVNDAVFETTTDDQGAFALELAAGSSFDVTIARGEDTLLETTFESPDGNVEDVVFELVEQIEGFSIGGAVVLAEGVEGSVEGLTITVEQTGQSLMLDDTGAFVFEGLEAGAYTLNVTGDAAQAAPTEVEISDADILDLSIEVRFAYAVSGVVTSSASGEPLAGVVVAIEGIDQPQTTDDAGAYRFEGLEPGTYAISWNADGFEALSRDVEVGDADLELDVSLNEEERFSLEVTVTGDGGELADATVALAGGLGAETVNAITDANGVATFEGIVAGQYELTISADGFEDLKIRAIPVINNTAMAAQLVPITRQPEVTNQGCATAPASGHHGKPMGGLLLAAMMGLALWRRRR